MYTRMRCVYTLIYKDTRMCVYIACISIQRYIRKYNKYRRYRNKEIEDMEKQGSDKMFGFFPLSFLDFSPEKPHKFP